MSKLNKELIKELRRELNKFIPQISINCVIFRFDGESLQVPVVQLANTSVWAIPGGYIYQDEDIEVAAKRILYEQTKISDLILSQFGTFGSADRSFTEEVEKFKEFGLTDDLIDYISQRFITIGYYSIIGREQTKLEPGPFFMQVKWIDSTDKDILALDHALLVSEALKTLRSQLLSKPLLLSFMPETFTIPELQKLYESILGRTVDRGNFRQRMLKSDFLIKIGTTIEKTRSRPPIVYRIDKQKYLDSLTQDVKLGF